MAWCLVKAQEQLQLLPGGVGVELHAFFNLGIMEVSGQLHAPLLK
jgi:hypothetical protein